MARVVIVHAPGAEPARHDLGDPVTAGGSQADGLLLPGAPPGALRLLPAAVGIVVEAGAAGVRVGGHAVHPGARRLLRPGERAEVGGVALTAGAAPPAEGTRAAASPVLRGEIEGDGAAILVLTGPRAGERHALGAGLTAGRGRDAGIRLPDPLASRVHVRIRPAPDGATIEDLRSKNGVRVNGVEIERRPHPVRPGDEIAIGGTLLCLEDPWRAVPDPPGGGPRSSAAPTSHRRRARIPSAALAALLLALTAAALAAAAS